MTKQGEKQYWFRTRKYGWGWGIPRTWQGWAAFGLFIGIWLNAMTWLVLSAEAPPVRNIVLFLVIIFLDVAGLMYVSFKHGEPPRWRWGGKHESNKPKPNRRTKKRSVQ